MSGLSVLHVVRRYGPAGGMERYVWELTRELVKLGCSVSVVCEQMVVDKPPEFVNVHVLGKSIPKPRWLSHLIFSRRLHNWLHQQQNRDLIIHSHERSRNHHITTFHGPPFARVLDMPVWKRLSLRALINLWLEKREVCAGQVYTVVPNSRQTGVLLEYYYPCIGARLSSPVPPGVLPGPARESHSVPESGGVIGFIGKEWKRKGLERAIEIVRKLRETKPDLEFWIAGPAPGDIQPLFKEQDEGYKLLGEVSSAKLYPKFDLLLHPALQEPYGMVITEAMAAAVPVVVSSCSGAADDVGASQGRVIDLAADNKIWIEACKQMLDSNIPLEKYSRSWAEVARAYASSYQQIQRNQNLK
ncbi:MAG: glycosyltransferase family 4 protein [Mariprofundaceae bacterium]